MSFQIKYWYTFKDLTNIEHKVEIYENTTNTLTALEIRGSNEPFVVDYGSRNKFDVVLGSGAELNLLSPSNMFFFNNLFTINPQQFLVKHYINGSINWMGFLNSELFRETFSELQNYDIQVTANDGFSLLDRFMFVDVNGNNYSGLKSYFELFQIIFNKMGLPFSELRISTSTTFSGYIETSGSTIFQYMKLNCENFYDEDNKPMSMREVLEEILKPFQCFIFQDKGNIYINDYNNIATNDSITYKRYSISNLNNYLGNVTENNVQQLVRTDYMNSSGDIETGAGINRQVVSYSAYPQKTLIEGITKLSEFSGGLEQPYSYNQIDTGYSYRTLSSNSIFQEYYPANFQQSYYNDSSNADFYLRFYRNTTQYKILDLKLSKYINIAASLNPDYFEGATKAGLSFKITFKLRPVSRTNPYSGSTSNFSNIQLKCKIGDGSKYYNQSNNNWSTNSSNYFWIGCKTTPDEWNDFQYSVPIITSLNSGDLNGILDFQIFNQFSTTTSILGDTSMNDERVKQIWIKDLKIELVDIVTGESISGDDIEYIATLNSLFKNEGNKIDLKVGTNVYYSDKAKLMDTNNVFITNFSRGNLSDKKVEELLLNSVVSNYEQSNVSINSLSLKNQYNLNNIVTSTYFPNKKFCVSGLRINYSENTSDINLTEIFQDNLTNE